MPFLLKIAWLIPAIPFLGAVFIAFLLISFTRTINRLTKPISFFLTTCVLFSTLISAITLFQNVTGQAYDLNLTLANFNLHLSFYLDLFIEKILSLTGLIISIIMISSYYILDRRDGYVRYLVSISAFSGFLFLVILNGLVPNSLI